MLNGFALPYSVQSLKQVKYAMCAQSLGEHQLEAHLPANPSKTSDFFPGYEYLLETVCAQVFGPFCGQRTSLPGIYCLLAYFKEYLAELLGGDAAGVLLLL